MTSFLDRVDRNIGEYLIGASIRATDGAANHLRWQTSTRAGTREVALPGADRSA
jgi:hypothetical protein